ncbi:TonB-dependent receptor domain-containing protein [Pseudoduganella namucuonensis]|uniref:TonB-dependent receptor domain-containing protein n=1 Tax=Pseudoduganella namucuonensis TaxID=1035707 RepID=UPI001160DA9C|nr:TonB-dependent receptor [Pseudoduganella namucuonensis]
MNHLPKPSTTSRLLLASCLCLAGGAHAQTAQKPPAPEKPQPAKPKPAPAAEPSKAAETPAETPVGTQTGTQAPAEMASVVVAAERQTTRIDRDVYDVKSDASSSNGTAADALNSVPSVAVDPDGSVTLRGSQNVQIMVDGKPSAMMQGDNRGAALMSIPADDIESIEVINNPGAQFGNEGGSGPILNLVMRRNRRAGGFAAINANAGTAGRYNTSVTGSYNTGPFGMQGGLNVRHDGRDSVGSTVRDRYDPFSGAMLHSTQTGSSTGLNDTVGVNGSVHYNATAKDTVGASFSYSGSSNDNQSLDHYLRYNQARLVDTDYVRTSARSGDRRNTGFGARWDHKGGADGEEFKMDLRVTDSDNTAFNRYANMYAPGSLRGTSGQSRQNNEADTRIIDYTGDYELPSDKGILRLGYKLSRTRSGNDILDVNIDPATQAETVNTQRTNRFSVTEKNYALYGSYEKPLDAYWGIQGGLRVERTELDIQQLTQNIDAANSYTNLIPSAYALRKWNDGTKLRFSYSHRIRRPNGNELNPFIIYRDEFNVSSGNPRLKPTQRDSIEVAYDAKYAGVDTKIRGYFNKETDAILERRYFINDTVLLTTRDNAGGTHSGGVELNLGGKLLPGLSLNGNMNLLRTQQRLLELTGAESRRMVNSLSARIRVNYQLGAADQLQAMIMAQGKTLMGQLERQPTTTVNLTLRHAFTPQFAMVLNVTDAFAGNRNKSLIDSATLKETRIFSYDSRIVYLGLTYRFGGFAPAGGGGRNNGGGGRNGGLGGVGPRPGVGD